VTLEQPDPRAAETDPDTTELAAPPAATGVLPAGEPVETQPSPAGEPVEIEPSSDGARGDGQSADGASGDGEGDGRRRRRRSRKPPKTTKRVVVEWVVLIVAALVIAFVIKTFLFQAFYIPSESMVPTLNVGDRVLVNKLSYDFHDVHRGDIVVFDAPPLARSNDIKDLVKRVIGLPGDTVTYPGTSGGDRVFINGKPLKEDYLPKGTVTNQSSNPKVPPGCDTPADGQPGCKVPAGHIFVMGDNRTESRDARFFGPIKESTIVGRVFLRIWPIGDIGFM
jgi:signal peptidase I